MCSRYILITAIVVWSAAIMSGQNPPQSPTPGAIHGKITNEAGEPVRGVVVALVRVFPVGGSDTPPMISTFSDGEGEYLLENLAPASYKACILPRGIPLLDPCLWSEDPPLWNLEAGRIGHLDVSLKRGRFLHVRVDGNPVAFGQLGRGSVDRSPLMEVRSNSGTPINLTEVGRDQAGRSYRVIVPDDEDIDIAFNPSEIRETGRETPPPGAAISASHRVTPNEVAKVLHFSVNGRP